MGTLFMSDGHPGAAQSQDAGKADGSASQALQRSTTTMTAERKQEIKRKMMARVRIMALAIRACMRMRLGAALRERVTKLLAAQPPGCRTPAQLEVLARFLGKVPALSHLSAPMIKDLARVMTSHEYLKGQVVCAQGDPAPGVCVVLQGGCNMHIKPHTPSYTAPLSPDSIDAFATVVSVDDLGPAVEYLGPGHGFGELPVVRADAGKLGGEDDGSAAAPPAALKPVLYSIASTARLILLEIGWSDCAAVLAGALPPSLAPKLAALSSFPCLRGLPPGFLKGLLHLAAPRTLPARAVLTRQGLPPDPLHAELVLITGGEVAVMVDPGLPPPSLGNASGGAGPAAPIGTGTERRRSNLAPAPGTTLGAQQVSRLGTGGMCGEAGILAAALCMDWHAHELYDDDDDGPSSTDPASAGSLGPRVRPLKLDELQGRINNDPTLAAAFTVPGANGGKQLLALAHGATIISSTEVTYYAVPIAPLLRRLPDTVVTDLRAYAVQRAEFQAQRCASMQGCEAYTRNYVATYTAVAAWADAGSGDTRAPRATTDGQTRPTDGGDAPRARRAVRRSNTFSGLSGASGGVLGLLTNLTKSNAALDAAAAAAAAAGTVPVGRGERRQSSGQLQLSAAASALAAGPQGLLPQGRAGSNRMQQLLDRLDTDTSSNMGLGGSGSRSSLTDGLGFIPGATPFGSGVLQSWQQQQQRGPQGGVSQSFTAGTGPAAAGVDGSGRPLMRPGLHARVSNASAGERGSNSSVDAGSLAVEQLRGQSFTQGDLPRRGSGSFAGGIWQVDSILARPSQGGAEGAKQGAAGWVKPNSWDPTNLAVDSGEREGSGDAPGGLLGTLLQRRRSNGYSSAGNGPDSGGLLPPIQQIASKGLGAGSGGGLAAAEAPASAAPAPAVGPVGPVRRAPSRTNSLRNVMGTLQRPAAPPAAVAVPTQPAPPNSAAPTQFTPRRVPGRSNTMGLMELAARTNSVIVTNQTSREAMHQAVMRVSIEGGAAQSSYSGTGVGPGSGSGSGPSYGSGHGMDSSVLSGRDSGLGSRSFTIGSSVAGAGRRFAGSLSSLQMLAATQGKAK